MRRRNRSPYSPWIGAIGVALLGSTAAAQDLGVGSYWLIDDANATVELPSLIRLQRSGDGAGRGYWEARFTAEAECDNGAALPLYATIFGSRVALVHRCSSIEFLDKCRLQAPDPEPEPKPEPANKTSRQDIGKDVVLAIRQSRERLEAFASGKQPPLEGASDHVADDPEADTGRSEESGETSRHITDTYSVAAKIRIRSAATKISGTYKTERWVTVPGADQHCRRRPEEDREYEFALTRTPCPRSLELTQPAAPDAELIEEWLTKLSIPRFAEQLDTVREKHARVCAPAGVIGSVATLSATQSLEACFALCEETDGWLVGIANEHGQDLPPGFHSRCRTQCGVLAEH